MVTGKKMRQVKIMNDIGMLTKINYVYYIFYFLLEYMALISLFPQNFIFWLQQCKRYSFKEKIPSSLLFNKSLYQIHPLIDYHDSNNYFHIPT